jgi:hemerythrin
MLKWNEQFETGHSLIDAQHRMLISYINRLEVFAQNTNPGAEEVELFIRVLEFLETYILTHFRNEEDCTYRFRCPAHSKNKQAHSEFVDFFLEFKLRLESRGYRTELVKQLSIYCSIWIQRHILLIDSELKHYQTLPSTSEELD